MAISSLDSSTMAQHVHTDSDADGVFVERNRLSRNDLNEDMQLQRPTPQRTAFRRYILRFLIFSFLLTCIVYVIVDFCGDRTIEKRWNNFLEQTQDQPYKAIIAVIACYIIATVFFVPGSILTFGAGFLIGHAFDNMYVGILLSVIVSRNCIRSERECGDLSPPPLMFSGERNSFGSRRSTQSRTFLVVCLHWSFHWFNLLISIGEVSFSRLCFTARIFVSNISSY